MAPVRERPPVQAAGCPCGRQSVPLVCDGTLAVHHTPGGDVCRNPWPNKET